MIGRAQYSRLMNVLAIDTSTSACSAALLLRDGRVAAHRLTVMARGQSEALMPMVKAVLDEAGLTIAELDLLAVTVGPGAFTGLRIGLAAARGFALASGLPLAGVPTPLAVAAAIPEAERVGRTVVVALDSKRDHPWIQFFRSDLTPLGAVEALAPDEVSARLTGPVLVAGDAGARLLAVLPDAVAASSPGWPDAVFVARLGAELWREGRAWPPEPLYLRAPDVTLPGSKS
ncbi:putative Glycoprotease family protein [Magnetospirillum molischianum DSM 120]|uniref:Putative Glycoprotease family protein n=1 Tax=Magnetospirillum molischianum DSM 120 TaxID=1150626 RepID=H8FT81_MAGML|nr:putative Glycoprotease family protein [Magnetospirillum molischianum DSM 120]